MRTRFSCRAWLALLAAAATFACVRPAGADGGLWVDRHTADDGHSADQQAILVYDAATSTETLIVTTKYKGAPSDFAWVLPVPSLPDRAQVATCPEARSAFDSLSRTTAPRAVEERGAGAGCSGCVPMAGGAGGGDSVGVTAGVDVVDRLAINGLDISLLEAAAGSDLAAWLNDNGYRFPVEGTAVVQQYVEKGWKFAAVKVDTAQDGARQGETWDAYFPQDPLRLTFHSEQMVFPMRISSLSTGTGEARVLLYVFSDHRVKAVTYPTVTAQAPAGLISVYQFASAYEASFQALLRQPEGRAFVVEYAGPSFDYSLARAGILSEEKDYYLTRLRTVLRAEDMADDVVLANAEGDTGHAIDLDLSRSGPAPGALLPLAAAAACFGACRRRGLSPRLAAKGALLLGLLLLGVCFSA